MAEKCTKSAAAFTLPEGEATDSNSGLQLPDDDQLRFTECRSRDTEC